MVDEVKTHFGGKNNVILEIAVISRNFLSILKSILLESYG